MTPAGIAFDAFGTLFDLSALRVRTRTVASHEGDELFAAFRTRLIPWTWHASASGVYVPFPVLAAQALQAAAREAGFPLERSRADYIVEGLLELPLYDDVKHALTLLRDARIPLAILSNGTAEGIAALVEHNGLGGFFEHLLAADSVERYKPAAAVYALATEAFGAPAGEITLVSGHEWDVAGAGHFGLRTAWVGRGDRFTPVLGVEPDLKGDDLAGVAAQLVR